MDSVSISTDSGVSGYLLFSALSAAVLCDLGDLILFFRFLWETLMKCAAGREFGGGPSPRPPRARVDWRVDTSANYSFLAARPIVSASTVVPSRRPVTFALSHINFKS